MKISELLQLRDRLNLVYSTEELTQLLTKLNFDLGGVNNEIQDPEFKNKILNLISNFESINRSIVAANANYQEILTSIRTQVNVEELKFFSENYKLETKYNVAENIRNIRVMTLKDSVQSEVLDRIRLHSNWQYPALEIGCRDGEWTNHLVASDPLYIADFHREFTESAIKEFPEEFQRRLRVYLLKSPEDLLTTMPKNQFNFIFSWNFMNYASLDTIKEYLKIAKELLRPGGTFMFSYNDGDRPAGAAMAENFFMTYVPKHMLVLMAESLGFEILNQRTRDISVSWIEVRKPGVLETNKAHQVLGKITRF